MGPGHTVDMNCPYLSVVMEHCYECYRKAAESVIICDGWSEDDVSFYCSFGDAAGPAGPAGNAGNSPLSTDVCS